MSLVEMDGVSKVFDGVPALSDVQFALEAGEVHGLLGENGAGKTTLMNILAGLYHPDGGSVRVDGQAVRFRSPRDARRMGIGMVHQHFMLVDSFSVYENLRLGDETVDNPQALEAFARSEGLPVKAGAPVWQLSVGERQRVEILKQLHRGVRVLILDEPTAVLTPQESSLLLASLRAQAERGRAVVLITHKLAEVLSVADRVTVLRRGRRVASVRRADASEGGLAVLMVGDQAPTPVAARSPSAPGPARLVVEQAVALGDRGNTALHGIDLRVAGGEVVGIVGVAGNGQHELAEVVAGLRPLTAGRISIAGRETTNRGAREAVGAGLGYVPEDRNGVGMVPALMLTDNAILRRFRQVPLRRGVWLNRREVGRWTQQLIERARVRVPNAQVLASQLSGGNQQRLIFAREVAQEPALLLVEQPTRGLDIAASAAVRETVFAVRRQGAGVLLISQDLDEVLALADRILVMYDGRFIGEGAPDSLTRERIGLWMGGRA